MLGHRSLPHALVTALNRHAKHAADAALRPDDMRRTSVGLQLPTWPQGFYIDAAIRSAGRLTAYRCNYSHYAARMIR